MFKLLSQFKIVGDIRNITKASEVIGISQPTLTQNLTRLEKSLGVTLLIRSKNGIELTEAGENVYQNTIETVKAYDHLLADVKDLNNKKKKIFSIGCGFNWTHTENLFNAIKNIAMSYDDITFNVTNGDTISFQEDLISNTCDIAMGTIPDRLVQHKEVSYHPIFKTKFMIYADKNHHLSSKSKVSDDDLENYQWVTLRYSNEPSNTDKIYDSVIGLNKIQFNCQSVTTSLKLVQNSEYLIFLSENFKDLAFNYGLVPLSTTRSLINVEVGIMYLKKNKLAKDIAHEIINTLNIDTQL